MFFCFLGPLVIFTVLWFSIYLVLWIGSTDLAQVKILNQNSSVFFYLEETQLDLELASQSYHLILQKSPMQLDYYLSKQICTKLLIPIVKQLLITKALWKLVSLFKQFSKEGLDSASNAQHSSINWKRSSGQESG